MNKHLPHLRWSALVHFIVVFDDRVSFLLCPIVDGLHALIYGCMAAPGGRPERHGGEGGDVEDVVLMHYECAVDVNSLLSTNSEWI
ncbi:uncharacterized protein BDZ99DRAFT_155294 [Mytilinidion resinicola]|uniref:Uncharacterized protein n=1 Tax=Mytilinidion resinicola TaxID=574789 RepID=A0A6A6Y870_9PEZI|nr:uncharacterized protein BDZ99DRAFT_155294 [Mytilinidion resinicola]KAF2804335.1 hypothetical protein BDZ99DRAFT_155294 [Mytilinidion resinicola]